MAPTPQTPHRLRGHLLTLLASVVLLASACSATPSWKPVESAEPLGPQTTNTTSDQQPPASSAGEAPPADDAPPELAFVEEATEEEPPSDGFCSASANIWIHSAALNLIGTESNTEMNQIAMANVAEWLERSTLFAEDASEARAEMFAAFGELQTTVGTDFDFDWMSFQASTAYANDSAAQVYDAARDELVSFINDDCSSLSMTDLRTDAKARATELTTQFGTDPSTVVESDSLPGHSIFTHASGRLIASFPTAWTHEEDRGDSIVDLIASPDIERFLAGDAIDGVRLQLVAAATVDDFRVLLDQTRTGSSCELTDDLTDQGTVRIIITQTFACLDHGASIIGQFNEGRGVGLVIEASFDRPNASRADLIRLASISNSALWS